jgi:hypothetical protein
MVLKSLIRTVESPTSSSGDDAVPGDFVGSAEKDLKRAIGILRRKRNSSSFARHKLDTLTPPSAKSETLTSISPEDELMPLWKPDWATSTSTNMIEPSLGLDQTDHGLSGLQTEDLFDTLFGLGDDSGMWDYRGLDLG